MQISIPNIITALRILIVPLFIILLINRQLGMALAVFIIAAVSDGLDGLLARLLNQRTLLGAYLDPIADKLLLMAAFISLAFMDLTPAWLAVLVISRDVLILIGIAIFTLIHMPMTMRPSLISKLTTLCQLLTIAVILLDLQQTAATRIAHATLLWSTALLTIASGLHYTYCGLNLLQQTSAGRSMD